MKRIIKITESDLVKIVKKLLKEQSDDDPRKKVKKAKEVEREITQGGDYDYDYIKNKIPLTDLPEIFYDATTGLGGDDEALIVAALLRIQKEKNPLTAWDKISSDYKRMYPSNIINGTTGDLYKDIEQDVELDIAYYDKKSIRQVYNDIQGNKSLTPQEDNPAYDKLCKYDNVEGNSKVTESIIKSEWGFKSLKTFQTWCQKDAKLYFFRNKRGGVTPNMCPIADGKLGCCTLTCFRGVEMNPKMLKDIDSFAERANMLY
jgi:hypothetical protein